MFAEWIAAFKTTKIYLERFNSSLKLNKSNLIIKETPSFDNENITKHKKTYNIKIFNEEVNITRRELDCLLLLSRGLKTKQIATILNISYRTVESYINNLKIKTNCSYSSSLIDNFMKNPINKLLSQ